MTCLVTHARVTHADRRRFNSEFCAKWSVACKSWRSIKPPQTQRSVLRGLRETSFWDFWPSLERVQATLENVLREGVLPCADSDVRNCTRSRRLHTGCEQMVLQLRERVGNRRMRGLSLQAWKRGSMLSAVVIAVNQDVCVCILSHYRKRHDKKNSMIPQSLVHRAHGLAPRTRWIPSAPVFLHWSSVAPYARRPWCVNTSYRIAFRDAVGLQTSWSPWSMWVASMSFADPVFIFEFPPDPSYSVVVQRVEGDGMGLPPRIINPVFDANTFRDEENPCFV